MNFHAGIIQGQRLCTGYKGRKRLVTVKVWRGGFPVAISHMKNGKNLVSACVVERIQINCCMILIKAWLLILHQGAEHGLCMTSEVMTVNGDILAWGLKIRSFQRKQRSQITFLPGESMVEIVIGIIRLDHRIIDRGV